MKYNYDEIMAHTSDYKELEFSERCSCLNCCSIFFVNELIEEDWSGNTVGMPLCPYCRSSDCIIGDISGIPMDMKTIRDIHDTIYKDTEYDEYT